MKDTASDAASKKKKEKDPFEPRPEQLANMLEEMLILEALGIDEIIAEVSIEPLSSDDEDDAADDGKEDAGNSIAKRAPGATKRKESSDKKRQRQERQYLEDQINIANEALKSAMESESDKDLKNAIKVAVRAGLRGELDEDGDPILPSNGGSGGGGGRGGRKKNDNKIYCTELLFQAYKIVHEREQKEKEASEAMAHEREVAEYNVRSVPLGEDRESRQYWAFIGDDRLFVQERVLLPTSSSSPVTTSSSSSSSSSSSKSNRGSPNRASTLTLSEAEKIAKALGSFKLTIHPQDSDSVKREKEKVNSSAESLKRLYESRPYKWTYKWSVYNTPTELWRLCEALDDRGIKEKALISQIKARFELTEPPKQYLKTGSDYIGRKVCKKYNKKTEFGIIDGWLPQEGDDVALWHVRWADDEEDMEEHEVERYLVGLDEEGGARDMSLVHSSSNLALALSTSSSSGSLATAAGTAEGKEDDYVPDIITSSFQTNNRARTAVKLSQLDLQGLKTELVRMHGLMSDGLKPLAQSYNREIKRAWERRVNESASVNDVKLCLLELEEVVHSLQKLEDRKEEEEEAKLRQQTIDSMVKEGWTFDATVDPYINKRARRFFRGHAASDGTIVALLPASKNNGSSVWQMEHDDGDVEDLDEAEVAAAIQHFEQNVLEDPDPVVDDGGDDDEDDMVDDDEEDGSDDGDEDGVDDEDFYLSTVFPTDVDKASTSSSSAAAANVKNEPATKKSTSSAAASKKNKKRKASNDSDEEDEEEEEAELEDTEDELDYDTPSQRQYLWPTGGVRSRWHDALHKAQTVSEVALGMYAFIDFAREYGVVADDPLDGMRKPQPLYVLRHKANQSTENVHGGKKGGGGRSRGGGGGSSSSSSSSSSRRGGGQSGRDGGRDRSNKRSNKRGRSRDWSEDYEDARPTRAAARKVISYAE